MNKRMFLVFDGDGHNKEDVYSLKHAEATLRANQDWLDRVVLLDEAGTKLKQWTHNLYERVIEIPVDCSREKEDEIVWSSGPNTCNLL